MKSNKIITSALLFLLLCFGVENSFAQSCASFPGKDGILTAGTSPTIVNTYYQGTASVTANASNTTIAVGAPRGNASRVAAGDLVLIIQMQSATITTLNDATYGTTSNVTAGTYEYAFVTATATNSITVARLYNSYTFDASTSAPQRFQVIRVPQYASAVLEANVTAPAWNGSTGGVVVLDVAGVLNFNGGNIDVSAKGFRGGAGRRLTGGTGGANTDYTNLSSRNFHGQKGEGIAGSPRYIFNSNNNQLDTTSLEYAGGSTGRGAPANGGGGGTDGNPTVNDQNSGGGGGGNGATGGIGGNTWTSNLARGGLGGITIPFTSSKLILGGGGGAGSVNNLSPTSE